MKTTYQQLSSRIRLAWRIVRDRDSNLVAHAQRELNHCYNSGDKMDVAMADHLVDMVRIFSAENHSGSSASFARHTLGKLLDFQPLGPLTGESHEWMQIGLRDGIPEFQNVRCGHVFRYGDQQAYDIDGVVFEEDGGVRFTGKYSRVPVVFPYVPRTVIAKVPAHATDTDKQHAARHALAMATP